MGKTIIKLIFFVGVMYLLFYLGKFYLNVKNPKLMKDLQTFVRTFRQPIPEGEKKNEVVEKKPFSKEEKEILGELSKARYNFPVFEKLQDFFHQKSLKDFLQKFRSSGKTEEVVKEDLKEDSSEEEKEILKSIREAEKEAESESVWKKLKK
jgi:Sec-independent protein translocase protein TatA